MSADALTTSAEVTDVYLMVLARRHRGRLATLDRRIATSAVVTDRHVVLQIP